MMPRKVVGEASGLCSLVRKSTEHYTLIPPVPHDTAKYPMLGSEFFVHQCLLQGLLPNRTYENFVAMLF